MREAKSSEEMRSILRPLGTPIMTVAGVFQLIFWFVAWANWLGGLGVVKGIFLTSGVVKVHYLVMTSHEISCTHINHLV